MTQLGKSGPAVSQLGLASMGRSGSYGAATIERAVPSGAAGERYDAAGMACRGSEK